MTTDIMLVAAGIVIAIVAHVIIALVVGVYSVCVLSSQISRREEGDQCEDL